MKNFVKEFRDFIATGNLIEIAVALILALKVKDVIDAFMAGVVDPILAAIFGKPNFNNVGFDLGDARVSIGLVITAAVNLVLVGLILFLVIKAYNRFKKDAPPAGPEAQVQLLTEIRDELRRR